MTVVKKMNDGVAMLLERMKTNPEEFIDFPTEKHISSKWGEIISDYEGYLEPKDQQALKNGLRAIHQQHFTEKVMQELIDPQLRLKLGAIPKGMFGDPVVKKEGTTQTI